MEYHPDRIQKITTIMPQLIGFCQPGDEVHLGLEGDPAFHGAYRGADRPTGTISEVRGVAPDREVDIALYSGTKITYHEGEISPKTTFEFTDAGFKGVLERVEGPPDAESTLSYRNVDVKSRGAGGDIDLAAFGSRLDQMEITLQQMAAGLSSDIVNLAVQSGHNIDTVTFASTLKESIVFEE